MMVSWQTRAFETLVRVIGLKRNLARIGDLIDDDDRLRTHLRRLRRFDQKSPPRSILRSWQHDKTEVDGFDLHMLSREAHQGERLILYLHGGGYLVGPSRAEWSLIARVAHEARADFAVLDYPKAPEHETTTTIGVALHAFQALAERVGAENLALFGTSAGGGLALVVMARLRDDSRGQPELAVLLSPAVDLSLEEEDVSALEAGDAILTTSFARAAGALYAGELSVTHPDVSPTYGDLHGLGPLHVFVGSREILLPSTETFVERAAAAGVDVHLTVEEGQQHAWPTAPTPEGTRTMRQMAELIAG